MSYLEKIKKLWTALRIAIKDTKHGLRVLSSVDRHVQASNLPDNIKELSAEIKLKVEQLQSLLSAFKDEMS